jgi:hypothetical protein
VAIEQYAVDHTNSLPGPIWTGVFFDYQSSLNERLGFYLATYLGLSAPDNTRREIEVLKCPASIESLPSRATSSSVNQPICFMTCWSVTNRAPNLEVTNFPFGRPSSPMVSPMKITQIKRPSEQWAITDADQLNVPYGATYYFYLPTDAVHNNRPGGSRPGEVSRNYLYFDGGVRVGKTSL